MKESRIISGKIEGVELIHKDSLLSHVLNISCVVLVEFHFHGGGGHFRDAHILIGNDGYVRDIIDKETMEHMVVNESIILQLKSELALWLIEHEKWRDN